MYLYVLYCSQTKVNHVLLKHFQFQFTFIHIYPVHIQRKKTLVQIQTTIESYS